MARVGPLSYLDAVWKQLLFLALLLGCAPPAARQPGVVTFTGMCDASGAVPLSGQRFAVADDEDNVIRVYDARRGGAPLQAVDLSPELKLATKRGKSAPETDIEAATRVGSLAFWLTSHGRSSSGKLKPERRRFFATELPAVDRPFAVVGEPYERLLEDLVADPRYAALGLAAASERAPKGKGGLNMEGMTARAERGVFIGFRSPVPQGKALIATLLNPEQVVRGAEPARFGPPQALDLGGLGVRALSLWRGRYLIIAGDASDRSRSQLYVWDGAGAARRVRLDLDALNPEGFFSNDAIDQVMLLSDDGSLLVERRECKRLKDPRAKRFRGLWVSGASLAP
jgi:hypothetical protein